MITIRWGVLQVALDAGRHPTQNAQEHGAANQQKRDLVVTRDVPSTQNPPTATERQRNGFSTATR